MRAGIQSIAKGPGLRRLWQLGMTYSQNMKLVVLPQAFRNMLPVLLTQTIILFQDTSLVYAIGAYDSAEGLRQVAGKIYGRPEEAYLLAAVVYIHHVLRPVDGSCKPPAAQDCHHPLRRAFSPREIFKP